jgi:hypothetical protein
LILRIEFNRLIDYLDHARVSVLGYFAHWPYSPSTRLKIASTFPNCRV